MLYVRVNATSANVCVGFDVLGIALQLENTFTFERKEEISFKGFEKAYCVKENNLVYQAYQRVFEYTKRELIPVEIGFEGKIPVSRGLGSSSSLIVAGVFGANAILGNVLSQDELFNLCCELEGHPDNVAPAIFGGLVASYKTAQGYRTIPYPVKNTLRFIVVIPPFKLSTHEARSVLPKSLPYADIVHNLSRIVHIPKAFAEGNIELLRELFDDRLHEPYRGSLIPKYEEIKEICLQEEAAFAISGSGSAMLIIALEDTIIKRLEKFKYDIKSLEIGQGVKIWEG